VRTVASQARFALSVQPESVDTLVTAFVAAASPDFCIVQRVGGSATPPFPDGAIEVQDPSDSLWYPCTYTSFDAFTQQIRYDRTGPTDFGTGFSYRWNPALLAVTPSSGTMI
jgi:hypothetical protein